jgi:hypothetical protein
MPHPASCPVYTGTLFPGVKWKGHEADHLPPSTAEVKNGGAIPPLPNTSSLFYLHGMEETMQFRNLVLPPAISNVNIKIYKTVTVPVVLYGNET